MYFRSSLSSALRVYNLLLIVCLQFASPQMNTGKNDQNYIDLSEVTFDDDNDKVSDQEEDSSMSYLEEKGLCIPQDRLEDVDFFPNFDDDWIRLDHVMESDVDDILGRNQEDSRKFLCSNSECKVTAKSDVCFRQDLQEHNKLRGNITNTLNFDYDDDDDRHLSISVEQEEAWKGKKPRTKIMRKENRNLMFPELHDRNRSPIMLKSEKIKKRCGHCQAEETPQWRTGPTGRNSLCNACGLRYKVGRLVSNYRPAASPSFDSSKHSNFYRRLIRKKMEVVDDYGMPI